MLLYGWPNYEFKHTLMVMKLYIQNISINQNISKSSYTTISLNILTILFTSLIYITFFFQRFACKNVI